MRKLAMWKCAGLAGVAMLAAAAVPAGAQDVPALKMRATNSYPADMPVGRAMDLFAKRVAELSGGKMTVQVYHLGKLYTEDKSIQAVLDGTVDMGMASMANHGPFTKVWQVLETPYLLDKNQLRKLVIQGDIGKELRAAAEKDGLRPMMIFETGGHRVVGGMKPIGMPNDVQQMKIRVPQSPVLLSFYRAAGANPTVVPWGETYLALANKTVDGVDANLASWPLGKLWEVTKHVTTTFWSPTATLTDVSVKWWNARTPKQKEILDQAAREAEQFSMKAEDQNEKQLRDQLTKNGITLRDLTPAELAAWRKVGMSIWPSMPGVDQAQLQRISKAAQSIK